MPTTWIALLVLIPAATPDGTPTSSQQLVPEKAPLVAEQAAGTVDSATDSTEVKPEELRRRTGRELLAAARETLARLARPEDDDLEAAAEELLFVYGELQEDRDLGSTLRAQYTKKVGFRLEQVSAQLKKRIARNKRLAESQAPKQIRGHDEVTEQLGQQAGGVAAPSPPRPGNASNAAFRRMPNDDYGQQLVELIQKTIAPSTWDVNGGYGTIYYWRPGRALIVRQTEEVHERIGGVLGQLHQLGQ